MTTRRIFLKTSSVRAVSSVATLALGARPSHRDGDIGASCLRDGATRRLRGPVSQDIPGEIDPGQLKTLALRALDAAQAAGASYADVRFTVIRRRTFYALGMPQESETLAVGVRALARGAWGFAAHNDWTPDLMVQLGRHAAEWAQMTAWPRVAPIVLVDHPPAAVGDWRTPVKRDPFTVPPKETLDFIAGFYQQAQHAHISLTVNLTFERTERTFVSTEGAYATQTVYTALGSEPHAGFVPNMIVLSAPTPRDATGQQAGRVSLPFVGPTGGGYEVLQEAPDLANFREWIETAQAVAAAKSFEQAGMYDVVFDGMATAAIINGTFGSALEYDRAVGYEAAQDGTSYLAPPLTILGSSHAPAAVTITADRTLARGAATVGWDDEGIAPQPFPLVENGVVVDYASGREFVAELAPWYQRSGRMVRSNGCMDSESAFAVPLVNTPNLLLHPSAQDADLNALVAGVNDGFLVCGGSLRMDFQRTGGQGSGGQMYRIRNGKRAELIKDGLYIFRSSSLWKNLVTLGSAQTTAVRGFSNVKGEPDQVVRHSVRSVAASFRGIRIMNAKLV